MELRYPNCAVLQFYPSDAFAFAPVSETVSASESPELSNPTGDGKGLDPVNALQDFEVHNRTDLARVRLGDPGSTLQLTSKRGMA